MEKKEEVMPDLVMEKHPNVTRATQERVKELLAKYKDTRYCKPCNYTMPGTEQSGVHAWSHHIAIVCQCGFISARRNSLMAHVHRVHKGEDRSVMQVDAACWMKLSETIPIPAKMPSLPIVPLQSHKRKNQPLVTDKPVKSQRMISMEEEPEIIKVIKMITPSKKKPVPAPRKSLQKRVDPITPYVPTPLKDLRREKLVQRIACKRNQRNELRKIVSAMDLKLAEMGKELTALEQQ